MKNLRIGLVAYLRRLSWRRYLLWTSGVLVVLFVVANTIMWLLYRERVLPNYSVGSAEVGNLPYGDLEKHLTAERLLPPHIELVKDDTKQSVDSAALGLKVDVAESTRHLKSQRSFLPLIALLRERTVPVSIRIDDKVFAKATASLEEKFKRDAVRQHITFEKDNFELDAGVNGYRLDTAALQDTLLRGAERGKQSLQAPTTVVKPEEGRTDLNDELKRLRRQLDVEVTFKHNGQTFRPSRAEMGKWFVQKGQTMELSEEKIRTYVQSLAADLYNVRDAAAAAAYALSNRRPTTFVLDTTPDPTRYTYCIGTKGVSATYLAGFVAKVAATLADPRGWNAGGLIVFSRVDSGCQFNIWLSASNQMTSFGGLCDATWSCRSGRNVVINFDRWQGATDAWNNAGGDLEDYRVMVTNHEVGHWLGFAHRYCPGAGQPAPVMQQQSINLQGCKFNPWPTQAELDTLI